MLLLWPPRCCCLPTAAFACWVEVCRVRPGLVSYVEIDRWVPPRCLPMLSICPALLHAVQGRAVKENGVLLGTLPRW